LGDINVLFGVEVEHAKAEAEKQYGAVYSDQKRAKVERWYFTIAANVPEVKFETRSDELTADGMARLRKMARSEGQADIRVVIEGHAKGGLIPVRGLARKRAERSSGSRRITYPAERPNRRVPRTDHTN
jgi:hypothetical protein